MILNIDELKIVQTSSDDSDVENIILNSPDIENMSEVNLYPKGTPTELLYKIYDENNLAGYIKLTRIRWFNRKAEISIMIKKEFQKKGFGTKVMRGIINYAFTKMNLHRLEAEVLEFNEPSIKLMEKLGFKREGSLREAKYNDGKYWDIYRYGLLRNEWEQLNNG